MIKAVKKFMVTFHIFTLQSQLRVPKLCCRAPCLKWVSAVAVATHTTLTPLKMKFLRRKFLSQLH